MKYSVFITETAQREIAGIYLYIRDKLENPIAANATVAKINTKIRSLGLFPKATQTKQMRDRKIYFAHAGNFTIFYTVLGKTVKVSSVVYSKRDLGKIIKNLE